MVPLRRAADATGTVVVVDVLRAFTTAALALERGAESITLVAEVAEARRLRDRWPDALTMGEVDGDRPAGFDLSNSPTEIATADVAGRRLIHRSTAGTRGAIAASDGATRMFAAAFVCAEATAAAITALDSETVSYVITGAHGHLDGDEDRACADYIAGLAAGVRPDPAPFLERVRRSTAGRRFAAEDGGAHRPTDLDWALRLDHIARPLPIARRDGHLVIRREEPMASSG